MAVFTADEELQEAIGKWIERKKLSKLLGLWVKGLTVDWNKLYGLSKPQRISAPTYPFARERYWVQPQGAPEADPPAEVSRLMCFEEIWQPVPPPDVQGCTSVAGGRTPGATDVQGCTSFAGDRTPGATDVSAQAGCIVHSLLCFLSDSDKQHSLRRHLETQNPDIKLFFISVAESFSKSSDVQGSTSVAGGRMPGATWRVEAGNRDSYRETFQSIAEVVAGLDAMLYLWPLENPAFIEDAAGIAAILQSLYRSALHPRRIVLAGEYSDGLELSHLESWIGFERSIGLVWPDTRLTTLIRDKSGAGENWEDWLPLLWHELTKSESTSVLYQQEKRCELRVLPTYRDVLVSREAGCRERPTYRDVLVSREAGCRERPAAEEVETLL